MSAQELNVEAVVGNLAQVLDFINNQAEAVGCSMKVVMQLDVAVEEIFVNIASYAYAPETGDATVVVEAREGEVIITFKDSGVPYDPLAKDDPDVNLPASQRRIGGLGIFMTKKIMDEMVYAYRDGQNVLTMKKFF